MSITAGSKLTDDPARPVLLAWQGGNGKVRGVENGPRHAWLPVPAPFPALVAPAPRPPRLLNHRLAATRFVFPLEAEAGSQLQCIHNSTALP